MFDFETRNPAEDKVHIFLQGQGITDPSIIPYSVAEMRFDIAPAIKSALIECAETGSFGYQMAGDSYKKAVCDWMLERHGWEIQPEWLVQSYGVVSALAGCVRAFSNEGDGVLIQTPVYPPFSRTVLSESRKLLTNQLIRKGDSYEIDFEDFEAKAKEAKVFILCSPHNPVGRVWTKEELYKMADICLKYDVMMVADEIHHDLIMPGHSHTVMATAHSGIASKCVICTAPSKTFNIAGLSTSNIVIADPELRKAFSSEMEGFINVPGLAACEAAYTQCAPWLDELLEYLDGNRKAVEEYIAAKLPKIKLTKLQGTYLMWLDMSAYGYNKDELHELLAEKAKLMVNDGESFGHGGEGFIRFNIACPRRYIYAGLDRLKAALED